MIPDYTSLTAELILRRPNGETDAASTQHVIRVLHEALNTYIDTVADDELILAMQVVVIMMTAGSGRKETPP